MGHGADCRMQQRRQRFRIANRVVCVRRAGFPCSLEEMQMFPSDTKYTAALECCAARDLRSPLPKALDFEPVH